jgi:ABC-type nitrate/sulfonate/bicarbonate transport system permease component
MSMSTVITDQDPDAEELDKPAGPDRTWLYGPAAMAMFLVVWEAWAYFAAIPELYLPRPSVVIMTLIELFAYKGLAYDLMLTLYRIFAGFFLAAIAGVAIGVAMGMSNTSRRYF